MEIQRLLGSDIVMAFDECTPFPATRRRGRGEHAALDALGGAVARRRSATGRGTRSSGSSRDRCTRELRAESAEALTAIGFDGYAIGGLAVGEGQAAMFEVLDYAPGHASRRTGRAT